MKSTRSTLTTAGHVPHQMHMPTGILCPVKVKVNAVKPALLPEPDRRGRQMAYALPGGGEMLA